MMLTAYQAITQNTPRPVKPATARSRPTPTKPHKPAVRILFTDANSSYRDLAATTLARAGYEVTGCTDGITTLMKVLGAAPGAWPVVVCAQRLPGMSGLRLAYALRQAVVPPAVFLIADSITPYERLQAQRLGIRQVIQRSQDLEPLLHALATVSACGH